MNEYLDIVDENDQVIGRDTRENVHKEHRIHRGVHVFILNSKGELLLQRRSLFKKDRPNYYDASVGAQVLSGESYKEAALRETQEELGFIPKKLVKICDYKSYSSRQKENRRLFATYYDGQFKIDKNEVGSVEFLHLSKIQEMIYKGKDFTSGFKISFAYYLVKLDKAVVSVKNAKSGREIARVVSPTTEAGAIEKRTKELLEMAGFAGGSPSLSRKKFALMGLNYIKRLKRRIVK